MNEYVKVISARDIYVGIDTLAHVMHFAMGLVIYPEKKN